MVDVDEYERLMAELELLRDIHAAERQLAEGDGVVLTVRSSRRQLDPAEVD